jgi:DNA-binding response OmpR family regulator
MRILLVEDDVDLGSAVKEALEQENNVVDLVTDGQSFKTAVKTAKFDVVLLDINLPDGSGLNFLKEARNGNEAIPVIILTARNALDQKIEGLNSGADDYLTKPFAVEELLARIRAVVRRNKGIASSTLKYEGLELDVAAHKFSSDGVEITLSPKEFLIMKSLMENAGKVVSKDTLENILYSWDNFIESNTVEVHVHHLRAKLKNNLIKTIRGAGYILKKND